MIIIKYKNINIKLVQSTDLLEALNLQYGNIFSYSEMLDIVYNILSNTDYGDDYVCVYLDDEDIDLYDKAKCVFTFLKDNFVEDEKVLIRI